MTTGMAKQSCRISFCSAAETLKVTEGPNNDSHKSPHTRHIAADIGLFIARGKGAALRLRSATATETTIQRR
jgi:hypothetical protein